MTPQAPTRPSNKSQPARPRSTSTPRTPTRRGHPRISSRGQPILAIRAHTSERRAAEFVHDALRELHSFIRDHDLKPAGPPFTIVNHTSEPGALDIEAVWPIDQAAAGAGRIHGGSLPTPLAGHPNPPSRAGRPEQDLAEVFL